MKSLWFKLLSWILKTKAYSRFAATWMAHYTFRRWGYPKFKVSRYFQIKKIVANYKGAFAFVSRDKYILNYRFNNAFTRCKWGHAGLIYFGEDGELKICHMKEKGLEHDYLVNLMQEVDNMAIIYFPTDKSMLNIDNMGFVLYDFSMDSPGKLYCSELVATALESEGIATIQRSVYGGRIFCTPDNVYNSGMVIFEE